MIKTDDQLGKIYDSAIEIVKSQNRASAKFLMKELQTSRQIANLCIELMARDGIISKPTYYGLRKVLV